VTVGCGGSPSRNPTDFTWSKHFKNETFPHHLRFLTEETINETLRDGRDCDRVEAGLGKLRRRKTFDGVDVVLVLAEQEAFIVTGWTEVSNLTEALASDRWTDADLRKIQAFERREHKKSNYLDP